MLSLPEAQCLLARPANIVGSRSTLRQRNAMDADKAVVVRGVTLVTTRADRTPSGQGPVRMGECDGD